MMPEASTVTLESGLTLSYLDQGDRSDRVLVLLPGPTDSWISYLPILDRVPQEIRTIAVSQRGHGNSDKPMIGYRVGDFATDVVALLAALDINRAVLAGHSGSSFVARRAAIDHPDRVAGLVLEASPTELHSDARFNEFFGSVISNLRDPIDVDLVRSFAIDTSSDDIGLDLLEQLVSEQMKVPARVWREMFAELLQYDDMAELARIIAPTMLIWGDTDGLIGREMQENLLRHISVAELVVYPGVGHTPRWEDPIRFATDVAAFVKRQFPLNDPSGRLRAPRMA